MGADYVDPRLLHDDPPFWKKIVIDALNDLLGKAKNQIDAAGGQFNEDYGTPDDTYTRGSDRPVAKISSDF